MKSLLNWSCSCILLWILPCLLVPQDAEAAYQNMGGSRILLMNNDGRTGTTGGITGQGYYDTNTLAGTTYWIHTPWNDNTKTTTRFLLHGTNHELHGADGTLLWHLVDCRAGYVAQGNASRNYIPWSARNAQASAPLTRNAKVDGKTINYYTNEVNSCVHMRNVAGAAIYSPHYSDGIGTIYFDTVNSYVANVNGSVELYIATNVTQAARDLGVDFETAGQDYDQYDWKLTPMTVLDIQNNAVASTREGVTNLLLNVTDGGTWRYFRVRTQLNYYGPIRFCIRRASVESDPSEDTVGLVLVDNVVASYPPATARLLIAGRDGEIGQDGAGCVGRIGDFSIPFVSVGQTNLFTQFCIEWVTNFQGTAQKIVVQDPKIHYRWRYLSQKVTDWREQVLTPQNVTFLNTPDATQFVSQVSIPLSDGVGDLEYFYTLDIDSAPCYLPRDYANDTAVGFGTKPGSTEKWSEAIGVVTNRLSYTELDALPSGGTDYFTRIREGASDYAWVKLVARVSTNAVENVFMELAGDHVWRAHYRVPPDAVGETLRFHAQGHEYVANPFGAASAWSIRTNTWYAQSAAVLSRLPAALALDMAGHDDVGLVLDDVSSHLLVEFDDVRGTVRVGHASYQDFNMWTDAVDGFRGNAVPYDDRPVAGTAPTGSPATKRAHLAAMDAWKPFSNASWREDFRLLRDSVCPLGVPLRHATTPAGWPAENGAFVAARRGDDSRLAWRMDGKGGGSVSLPESLPGVGEVKVSARLSQPVAFEDFATYLDGGRCTNYAVSAQLTMSRLYAKDQCPIDISPLHPSVSLVGYHRGSKGCYELRFVRVDDLHLGAELWKWTKAEDGEMASTMLTSDLLSRAPSGAKPGPGQATFNAFNNLLVPQAESDRNNNWTSAMFSLYTSGDTVKLDGWLSPYRNAKRLDQDVASLRNVIHFEDADPGELKRGSYGVGSSDCLAAFGQMQCHPFAVAYTGTSANFYGVNLTGRDLSSLDFAEDWDMMYGRWRQLTVLESPQWRGSGLSAVMPVDQSVEVLVAEKIGNGMGPWRSVGCVTNVATFSTDTYTLAVRTAPEVYVQLRTGGSEASVTVDDLEATAWTAEDRGSENYSFYDQWSYTRAVVEATENGTSCRLQPARGVIEGQDGEYEGQVEPMGVRSPYLENGLSLISVDYANANSNTVLWLQVNTDCPDYRMVPYCTRRSPEHENWTPGWKTKCVWVFPGAAKGVTATSGAVRDGVATNIVSASELKKGTLSFCQSLRAPIKGVMRVVVAPEVVREGVRRARSDPEYGQITITKACCYDEPALDWRCWWGWNLHVAGAAASDRAYANLLDPSGLSCMLNFSALAADNNHKEANGIGLGEENVVEYAKNNPFVQCPPLTNGIGAVSFRARAFTNGQACSSWVTLYGSREPDAYQITDWNMWVRPDSETGGYKPLAEFEITNTTFQTFTWKTTDDNEPPIAVRLEVTAARLGRYGSGYNPAWEKPPATPIQRVLLDDISVAESMDAAFSFANAAPTQTAPVHVPHAWLDAYPELVAAAGGDYESAAQAPVGNGATAGSVPMRVWQAFVAGTDPTDPTDELRLDIRVEGGERRVTWTPDLNEGGKKNVRVYTVWGTPTLNPPAWHSPTNASDRFFKVTVRMP